MNASVGIGPEAPSVSYHLALDLAHRVPTARGHGVLPRAGTNLQRGIENDISMSDFDRNYAATRRFGADRAVAVDAGVRAHMLRVYNYMAAGVALTGWNNRYILEIITVLAPLPRAP
jgi:hypothetical protein